jgi:hypothetical protein
LGETGEEAAAIEPADSVARALVAVVVGAVAAVGDAAKDTSRNEPARGVDPLGGMEAMATDRCVGRLAGGNADADGCTRPPSLKWLALTGLCGGVKRTRAEDESTYVFENAEEGCLSCAN